MRGHVDAETLAAFREGLLSRRKAARVSAHLAVCPRCAALDAELAGVTALLTRTTAPPMPEALTARIQAALAAEAAARTAATDATPAAAAHAAPAAAAHAAPATGAGVAAPGTAGRARTRGGRRATGRRAGSPGPGRTRLALRVAAVAAAVAVLAGGGYGVARLLSGSPSLTTAAPATGAGAAMRKSAIPSGGIHSAPGSLAAPGYAAASGRIVSSGTNYQRATLGAQASALLARLGPKAHASARTPLSRSAPQNGAAAAFPHLEACLAHVAGAQHVLLTDIARYQAHPALIVILSGPPGTLRALVIAPACTATQAHILATAPLPASG